MSVRIIHGDCRDVLPTLPADSFDCCVTSPPYWGLRDYGVDGQIGLEQTMQEYLKTMVGVCREIWRVLKPEGTFWLNVGDSYAGSGRGGNPDGNTKQATNTGSQGIGVLYGLNEQDREAERARIKQQFEAQRAAGLKPKDLCMIPNRLAIMLQEPWHDGPIKRDVDRAWLAGIIDADGCIGIRRQQQDGRWNPSYIPYLTVGCSDAAILDRCVEITGLGKVNLKSHAGDTDNRGIKQRRDGYVWRLDGQVASKAIRDIYPFLIQKRQQALLCNAMNISQSGGRFDRGNPVPSDVLAYRQTLYESIKALNQRQDVIIPDIPAVVPNIEPGWYVRSEIIWHKPNPMPESVRDRPTCAHEKVWLLTKSDKYFYDADAIREADSGKPSGNGFVRPERETYAGRGNKEQREPGGGRNCRNFWPIASQPYSGAHFATMPPALAERCIKAGCQEGGTVLDPFGGAGTTGLVADRLGRNATLIELNSEYRGLAESRITRDAPLLSEIGA